MSAPRRRPGTRPSVAEIERAAAMRYEDGWLNAGTISATLGISRKTLWRWKRRPEYQVADAAAFAAWQAEFNARIAAERAQRSAAYAVAHPRRRR